MTVEEKARMIEKYCDYITDCSECAIKDNEVTCYGKYDEFPEEIEKNYDIIFGNDKDKEEKKKTEDEEEKMTIEEKAKMIEKHCDSMPSCSACPIGSKDGSFVCFSDWEDNPNDIEKNYEIIFGNNEDMDEEKKSDDTVNHPSHYTHGGVECIDAITSALSSYEDSVDSWLVGQVIKYLWRAPLKGKYEEDIKKAQFYLNRLVEKIDKNW